MDTDAVVAAMRSPAGASAALLRAARAGRVTLVASVPLCLQYEAVCSRPEHVAAAGLAPADLTVFLDAVAALAEPVETWFLWRPQLRDPGDELVLEAAVNGRADAIATFNLRDFLPAAPRLGVEVLRPAAALRRIAP
jgi:predicted nucleic acid-binding protein